METMGEPTPTARDVRLEQQIHLWLEAAIAQSDDGWNGKLLVDLIKGHDTRGEISPALADRLAEILSPALDLHYHDAKESVCHDIASKLGEFRADLKEKAYKLVDKGEVKTDPQLAKMIMMQVNTYLCRAETAIRRQADKYTPPPTHPDHNLPRQCGDYTSN